MTLSYVISEIFSIELNLVEAWKVSFKITDSGSRQQIMYDFLSAYHYNHYSMLYNLSRVSVLTRDIDIAILSVHLVD